MKQLLSKLTTLQSAQLTVTPVMSNPEPMQYTLPVDSQAGSGSGANSGPHGAGAGTERSRVQELVQPLLSTTTKLKVHKLPSDGGIQETHCESTAPSIEPQVTVHA
jgi:hypothetical protein